MTGETGALREGTMYDVWGTRRSLDGKPLPNTTSTPDTLDDKVDNKGYTGHEMLDQLDLVHMNGRVYDPLVGRFLSADPLLQDPQNGQSYNRYSYVMNNPTNWTDPTGFACDPPTGSHICGRDPVAVRSADGGSIGIYRNKADADKAIAQNGGRIVSLTAKLVDAKNNPTVAARNNGGDSANTTNWTGGQTKDMTASQAAGTAVEGLKGDPIVNTITTVVVTGKKMVSDAYNWAFGDTQASALAKQDLWANKIHYANGLMAVGMLRGGNPAARNYYRGAKPGTNPSFTPRPGDYKVDPVTGFVKDTHGVSVFDNAASVSSKGFDPHLIDMNSMPDTLRIIQRGADPRHFEVVPQPGANLTPQQFINACSSIVCK